MWTRCNFWCPTPQVCVEECPRTYWTSAQWKSSGLEQFCDNLTVGQLGYASTSISQLVAERSCLAYLLPVTWSKWFDACWLDQSEGLDAKHCVEEEVKVSLRFYAITKGRDN